VLKLPAHSGTWFDKLTTSGIPLFPIVLSLSKDLSPRQIF